ncbi:MAG: hypothetical protein J3T61_11240 [Candidatus Brocadiales bacterium]|nr:hypothetical protein [Candidatus Bathyanammoxibius sp.]
MELLETINAAARLVNRASERAGAGLKEEALDLMLELRDHLNEPLVLPAGKQPEKEENTDQLYG